MKKFTLVVAIILLAILAVSLTACGGGGGTNSIYGKYYEYENGAKNPDSYYELKSGNKWTCNTGESGEFTINGNAITIIFEGEEFMTGTVKNGILSLELWGMPAGDYYKDGAYPTSNGGSNNGGGSDNGDSKPELPTYSDDYVEFSPAVEGIKNDDDFYLHYYDKVDEYIYVELDIEYVGLGNAGKANNFRLGDWENLIFYTNEGCLLTWYTDADFSRINGAQVFTLNYGSNIHFLTVSSQGIVRKTYLVDFYLVRDCYINLCDHIGGEPYASIRIDEGGTFDKNYEWRWADKFEVDERVYYNSSTGRYEKFDYSTIINQDWTLYQTYDKKTITYLNADGESKTLKITPYEDVDLPTPSKDGYTFIGWQQPNKKMFTDIEGESRLQLTGDNYFETLTPIWKENVFEKIDTVSSTAFKVVIPTLYYNNGELYKLVYYTHDNEICYEEQCHISESTKTDKAYFCGDEITLAAMENPGYTWLGWYDGSIELTTENTCRVTLPAENKTYTAKWMYYIVSTETNLEGAGTYTVKDDEKITVGESVTLTATTNLGYAWLGWFDGDVKVSDDTTYTFIMAEENKTYTAKWEINAEMQNFNFTSTPTSCTITGIKDKDVTSITIPASVTTINQGAFAACSSLKSVTFGENSKLTSIGEYAFSSCSSLKSITIPDGVTTISRYAFKNCTGLTSIIIPDSVTTVNGAFSGCSAIVKATMPAIAIGFIPDNSLKTVVITSGTTIDSYAFEDCTSLTSIVIPDSVTSIGSYAFEECTGLTTVTFGENSQLTTIGYRAFEGCISLTSINIPSSVTAIARFAFNKCSKLTYKTYNNAKYLGNEANPYVVLLSATSTDIISCAINKSCKIILDSAFIYNNLTSITIPSSVTTIGEEAFYGCDSLTNVIIEDMESWCKIEFGNAGANPLVYGENLYIGETKVTNLVIPDGITEIKQYAFYGCDSLTSITIPSSVTTIGAAAFMRCDSLKSVTFDENSQLTTIGEAAFENCTRLTSIVIPEGVTEIDEGAFYGCSSLTSIEIPASVTTIGKYAFEDCTGLTTVTFEDPNGWYVTKTLSATSGTTLTLTNTSTNVTYLRSTYYTYYWYKK